MRTDSFQSGFQTPAQVNPFDQQNNRFGQQSGNTSSFGTPFGQQNTAQAQVNSFEQPGRSGFGQQSSTQNAFENNQSQSNMSFGETNTMDSKAHLQSKRSFGHPSQSSLGPDRSPQANTFERPKTAPAQSNTLTPNGRMVNKSGQFLGRVQSVPTEGFAVSIKRLGKPKFFDYKTVEECLNEWAKP